MDASKALLAYMMKPEAQIATLRATNFFPVVDVALPDDLPPSVKAAGDAIAKMSGSADANPGLLPAGLGDKGGDFNRVFVDSFERIVLGGQDIRAVLDDQADVLSGSWRKPAPSAGPPMHRPKVPARSNKTALSDNGDPGQRWPVHPERRPTNRQGAIR